MKNTLILAMVLIISATAFGQDRKGDKKARKEKIKAMKVEYITKKLDLTSAEAEKFWPVHNEFEAKMDKLRKKRRLESKKGKGAPKLSDAEIEKRINARFNTEQQQLNLKKEYHTKFKAVLPIQKVAKLYKAEHNFKRELLKKMRVKKGGPNELNIPPPPTPPTPPTVK